MEQITRVVERGEAVRVGVDLAKRVIQVHGVDAAGHVLTSRALVRDKFLAWCMQLPAGCIVAMETSSSAHHWARKLIALGLEDLVYTNKWLDGMLLCKHLTAIPTVRGRLPYDLKTAVAERWPEHAD